MDKVIRALHHQCLPARNRNDAKALKTVKSARPLHEIPPPDAVPRIAQDRSAHRLAEHGGGQQAAGHGSRIARTPARMNPLCGVLQRLSMPNCAPQRRQVRARALIIQPQEKWSMTGKTLLIRGRPGKAAIGIAAFLPDTLLAVAEARAQVRAFAKILCNLQSLVL